MKPYMEDGDQKSIMDIINENDPTIEQTSTEQMPPDAPMSPGELKRIELIRMMKADTDKIEYMVMLNTLILSLLLISIWHFSAYRSWVDIVCMVLAAAYFVYTRSKLKASTIKLVDHKNNFDLYLWEGFHLKEMRHSAVKFAYMVFFPMVCVLLVDLISGYTFEIPLYAKISVALVFSTIGWFVFFGDDQRTLEAIETDLKALAYM
jgi:hypothetical protein